MYLKALEIQGFKSFPDKTVLNFGSDITAIVGPNGSGKSNVSDAIRWVMGEQSTKSLRGTKMEDVIFGGTEKRNQMGFAQVTLVLDNTEQIFPGMEESEISVTRRYYRSGESEYYINKQSVRLRDVNELFMDTGLGREGYSIIGQGRIDEILSVRSEDRREIFEEAAGISKFRHRKEETERKLERTEENLLRINDKIAELEMQVEPLRKQAVKANKYLVLRDELRLLEISVWLENLDGIRTDIVRLNTDYALAAADVERTRAAQEALYSASERFSQSAQENDIESERLRGELAAADSRIGEQDSAVAVLRADIAHNEDSIVRIEEELRGQSDRSDSLSRQIAEKQEYLNMLAAQASALQTELDRLLSDAERTAQSIGEAENELDALRLQETSCRSAIADERSEVSALQSGICEMNDRRTALSAEAEDLRGQITAAAAAAAAAQQSLEQAQEASDSIRNIVSGHELMLESRRRREKEASDRCVALTMELNNLDSRIRMLSEMEKEYTGFHTAVRSLMQAAEKKMLRGIHGPAANLMRTEQCYAIAIEVALGTGMQSIVVDREEDAKSAISYLKSREGGRATFLPLSVIRGDCLRDERIAQESGFVGIASELIRFDEQYREIFENLLGRTVIAENMDCGIAIARKFSHAFRIVTLDGQVINRGGSITGGSISRSAGILSRANELSALNGRRVTLREALEQARREADEAKSQMSLTQYELNNSQDEQRSAEDEVLRLTGEKKQYDVLMQTLRSRADDIAAECEGIAQRIAENGRLSDESGQRIAASEREMERIRSEIGKKTAGQSEAMRCTARLTDAVTEQKSLLAANLAGQDAEKRALADLCVLSEQMRGDERGRRSLIESCRRRIAEAQQKILSHESEIARCRKEADSLREGLSALSEAKLSLEAQRSANDRSLRETNDTLLSCERAAGLLEQKRSTASLEEQQILDKLWESYELSYSAAQEQRIELESLQKANRSISELKREMGALGSINIGAIEDFERVNTRYTYLTAQRDDVESAKKELLGIIGNLTEEMSGIFSQQFGQIRESFQETFSELFGGGAATLELEQPDDVLSSGIEIKVQPPGKALKTLTLLSGGEKAFVAIALYFAILKVHPTPFCVMDEIEAALDEPNVIRVANYMRRICKKTQFLVITHRRGTMESADVLYGVTMQERGVSKVLTINMNDMAKELKIKG